MKFNQLVPELTVMDLPKSVDFYTHILGFTIEYQRDESKLVVLSFQGSQIMIQQYNGNWQTGKLEYPLGKGINFQISVKKIEPLLTSLEKNKYPLFLPKMENWYRVNNELHGETEFLVQDPDGYLLRFSESLGSKPVE